MAHILIIMFKYSLSCMYVQIWCYAEEIFTTHRRTADEDKKDSFLGPGTLIKRMFGVLTISNEHFSVHFSDVRNKTKTNDSF